MIFSQKLRRRAVIERRSATWQIFGADGTWQA